MPDTLGLILIIIVTLLALWVCMKIAGLAALCRKEADGFSQEQPSSISELKHATTRWLIIERKATLEEMQALSGHADLRERADHLRSLLETLPVAGFLGTVIPVAQALILNADDSSNALAKNLSDSLGSALITTGIGLAGFIVGLVIYAGVERRLSEIERLAILQVASAKGDQA